MSLIGADAVLVLLNPSCQDSAPKSTSAMAEFGFPMFGMFQQRSQEVTCATLPVQVSFQSMGTRH